MEGWSSKDKFAVVLETAPLNAAELAEYCRRKGLYPEQIAAWRAACQAANANAAEQAREQRHQSKDDKQRIRQLEKEARQRNPRRWSRSTRDWELKDEVWLIPERMQPAELKQFA